MPLAQSQPQGRQWNEAPNKDDDGEQSEGLSTTPDANATIYTGGLEPAKYKVHNNKWERRPAWHATGVIWERFEADMLK